MTLLIQYIVESSQNEYFIQRSLIHVGGPNAPLLFSGKARRSFSLRSTEPRLPEIRTLFRNYLPESKDWNKNIPIHPELQTKLADLLGVDRFLKNTLIYIKLPEDTTSLFTQGRTRGRRGIVNPDTGRVVIRRRTINKILKEYHLRGGPISLPYIFFDDNTSFEYHGNCLVNYLLKTYVDLNKNKRIAAKKIITFFKDDTTADNLIKFAKSKNIRIRLYDVFGKSIYTDMLPDVPANKTRKEIVAILYNYHIYPYTKSLKKNLDLTMDLTKTHGVNITDRFGKYKTEDEEIDEMCKYLTKKITPNFFHLSEERIIMKSFWLNLGEEVPYEEWNNYETFDMNKAFHTVLYSYTDDKEEIPVFTVRDLFEPFNCEDFVMSKYYYLISKEGSQKMRNNMVTSGYYDNLLHGFEVLYILNQRIINKSDILFVKKPSYHILTFKFKEALAAILIKFHINEQNFKDKYPLYNGLLGMIFKRFNIITIQCSTGLDAELIYTIRADNASLITNIEGDTVNFGKKQIYRYINNRNLYNFVIARTRFVMMKTIKRIGLQPIKITTDSVTYLKTTDVEIPRDFKIEKTHFNIVNPRVYYHDGNKIIAETKENLKIFFDKIEVIRGAPGTGKTYKVQHEREYHFAMTSTNMCASNMTNNNIKADTIYKSLALYDPDSIYEQMRKYKNKILWVDEFSMIHRYIYNYFYILSLNCHSIIFSGDENQLPPIKESKLSLDTYFTRMFFKNSSVLTKDYRNDSELIKFRNIILQKSDAYTLDYCNGIKKTVINPNIKYHITSSHKMRMYVNDTIMTSLGYHYETKRKYNGTRYTNGNEIPNYTYSFRVSRGVRLRARCTIKSRDVYKNCLYTLITEVEYGGHFQVIRDNTEVVLEFDNMYMKYFIVGYAFTVHSSQGLTISEPTAIYQYKQMTGHGRQNLYTAVTRLTKYEHLWLYDVPEGFVYRKFIKNKNTSILADDEQFENGAYKDLEAF